MSQDAPKKGPTATPEEVKRMQKAVPGGEAQKGSHVAKNQAAMDAANAAKQPPKKP